MEEIDMKICLKKIKKTNRIAKILSQRQKRSLKSFCFFFTWTKKPKFLVNIVVMKKPFIKKLQINIVEVDVKRILLSSEHSYGNNG